MRLRVICLTLLFLCFVYPAVSFAAENPIRIFIDDEPLDETFEPQIIEGRTFVPIRVIAEKWGASVGWNQANEQVRIQKDRLIIDLFINQHEAIVNHEEVYSDAPPIVVKGRTLIPLRFVGELLGANVRYDRESHSVFVHLPQDPNEKPSVEPDEGDKDQEDFEQQPPQPDAVALNGIAIAENQVIISTSGDAEFNDFYLKDPERIVLDFTNSYYEIEDDSHSYDPKTYQGIIPSDEGMIQSVRYGMNDVEESIARVVIDLDTRGDYQIDADPENRHIIITVNPGIYKVVVDAGHGGHDPGAKGYTGKSEKWFNLSVAKKITNLLEDEPRIQPYLTRATDDFVTLQRRAEFANEIDADLFMSVHANAYTRATRGTETYYYHAHSKSFGEIVHRNLVNATGFPDRKLQHAGFYVIKNTDMPSVLIEAGFLTNPTEEEILFNDDFQKKVAKAMADAIIEYLGV